MNDGLDKLITAIDAKGKLFPAPKLRVHQDGLHHLAISVFLYSKKGLLLQRRALGKYHSGGLWANSCCSHPDWGEKIEKCVRRRCLDELNLNVDVIQLGVLDYIADVGNGLIENERAHIFAGEVSENSSQVAPNPNEVSETRWVSRSQLTEELVEHPKKFTPWFKQYMSRDDDALVALREKIWLRVENDFNP